MRGIYALYSNPGAAQLAVDLLRKKGAEWGFGPRAIVVLSSEPWKGYEFSGSEAWTAMPWIAAVGGLLGGLSGYALTAFTQRSFPLPTGGMAIVSLWTNGIIIYELTMLGAILATLLTLLAVAHIPNWRRHLYDPAVSDGKILVGVLDPPENAQAELQTTLLEAGAEQVKEFCWG